MINYPREQQETPKIGGHAWRSRSVLLVDVTESKEIHIPPWPSDEAQVLPLILKADDTRVYALAFDIQNEENLPKSSRAEALRQLEEGFGSSPWKLSVRVNGVFRHYVVDEEEGVSCCSRG